jgi:hypothetical protein
LNINRLETVLENKKNCLQAKKSTLTGGFFLSVTPFSKAKSDLL